MNTQTVLIAVFVAILGATMAFSPVVAQMQVPSIGPTPGDVGIKQGAPVGVEEPMVVPEQKPPVKLPFKPVLKPAEPVPSVGAPVGVEEPQMQVPEEPMVVPEPPMVVPDVKPVEEKCVCEENAIVIPVNVTDEEPIPEETEEVVTDVVETVVNATEDNEDDKANALVELLKQLVANDQAQQELFEQEKDDTESKLEAYLEEIEAEE